MCPAGWRVPTKEDFEELLTVTHKNTTFNGVKVIAFGTAPNTVYFPFAGTFANNGDRMSAEGFGWHKYQVAKYLSSTYDEKYGYYALWANNFNYEPEVDHSFNRGKNKITVRCVCETNTAE
jgi:uncharacterized protein (TIGR02145 family)